MANTRSVTTPKRGAKLRRWAAAAAVSAALHGVALSAVHYLSRPPAAARRLLEIRLGEITQKRFEHIKEAKERLKRGNFDTGEFIFKALTLDRAFETLSAEEHFDFELEWSKVRLRLKEEQAKHLDLTMHPLHYGLQEFKSRTAGSATVVYSGLQHNALDRLMSGVPLQNCRATALFQLATSPFPNLKVELFQRHVQTTHQLNETQWYSPYNGAPPSLPKGDVYEAKHLIDWYERSVAAGKTGFEFPSSSKKYEGAASVLESFETPKTPAQARSTSGNKNGVTRSGTSSLWNFIYAIEPSEEDVEDVDVDGSIIPQRTEQPTSENNAIQSTGSSSNVLIGVRLVDDHPKAGAIHANHVKADALSDLARRTVEMNRLYQTATSLAEHEFLKNELNEGAVYHLDGYAHVLKLLKKSKAHAEELNAAVNKKDHPEVHKSLDGINAEIARKISEIEKRANHVLRRLGILNEAGELKFTGPAVGLDIYSYDVLNLFLLTNGVEAAAKVVNETHDVHTLSNLSRYAPRAVSKVYPFLLPSKRRVLNQFERFNNLTAGQNERDFFYQPGEPLREEQLELVRQLITEAQNLPVQDKIARLSAAAGTLQSFELSDLGFP